MFHNTHFKYFQTWPSMLALLKLHHISLYRLNQPEKYIQTVLLKLLTFPPHFLRTKCCII